MRRICIKGTFLHQADAVPAVGRYSSRCCRSELISSLKDSITSYISCMDFWCLLSRSAISALAVLVPAACVSSSFMRACRLSGSSRLLRAFSTLENMLMYDEAFAYSARNCSGYNMACFVTARASEVIFQDIVCDCFSFILFFY